MLFVNNSEHPVALVAPDAPRKSDGEPESRIVGSVLDLNELVQAVGVQFRRATTCFDSRWSFSTASIRIIELPWACSSAGRAPALQAS